MITFIDARHRSANSSHREASLGLACRFILTMTCLPSAISNLSFHSPTPDSFADYFSASYFRGRGGIFEMPTGSYVNCISLFTHFALLALIHLLSSRSVKSLLSSTPLDSYLHHAPSAITPHHTNL